MVQLSVQDSVRTSNDSDVSTPRLKRPVGYHPYAFAVFVVTSLYAANFGKSPLTDVLLPLFAVAGLAALAIFVMRLFMSDHLRATLAASYFLVLSFSFSHLYYAAQRFVSFDIPRRYSLAAYACALIVGVVVLHRTKYNEARATGMLNCFSILLVVVSLVMIGSSMAQRGSGEGAPATARHEEPIDLHRPDQPRDIYYLVFDRYASNPTLREHFGFDNTTFLDKLAQRGFYCANESRANYPSTVMSMSTALNMNYHDDAVKEEYYYADLVRNHRVGRLLKGLGYKYYHYGNWYYPLRSNKNADYNFRISRLPSEFADVLYKQTPIGHLDVADLTRTWGDPKIPMLKFDAVAEMAQRDGPKFIYAHFLLPHPPFVLDKDGTRLSDEVLKSRTNSENYLNQLIYTNQRIIQLVDAIQQASTRPPIIIIQGDEGPLLYEGDKEKSWAERSRKRTGIISAFHLPGVDMQQEVASSITPVNTFRLVFNQYFGAELELLEDRSFFWHHHSPFNPRGQRCIEVTDEVRSVGTES